MLGVVGVLDVLNALNELSVLNVLNMPMDASFACWALFNIQKSAEKYKNKAHKANDASSC